jgi:hypothetical protein
MRSTRDMGKRTIQTGFKKKKGVVRRIDMAFEGWL